MTCIAVRCPHGQSDQIVTRGQTGGGTQQYVCQNTTCATGRFLLDYRYLGRLPEGKHPRMGRRLNASGVRDTARGLRSSTDTVLRDRRQQAAARESMQPHSCAPTTQTTWQGPSRVRERKPRWTNGHLHI